MELNWFKKCALILLSAAMLLQGKSVSTTLMTCHSSGKELVAIGTFDACCASDRSAPASSVQDNCCDFSQNLQFFSQLLSAQDGLKVLQPASPQILRLEWPFLLTSVIKKFNRQSKIPPIWRSDFLAYFCKLNI